MSSEVSIPPVRLLPEELANKIAAGEVVERPASVVKELVENALDAHATRIAVRLVAAGRRTIEIVDNGHGMSEQDALLAIERHATSKIRKAEDLDAIRTLGFRGEALASIAAVSHFELTTRRTRDESATRIRVDGGVLRDVSHVAAPVGTRVTVGRLYFNTPVRAKFLKGITTELSHCIDCVQRHALAQIGVGFQFFHNDKPLLDIPEMASLRERAALIWGLGFAKDMLDLEGEQAGFTFRGLIGSPRLSRSQRSHQFFFINRRPVVNRSLQYGLEEGYRGLLTVGRHPVAIVLLETHPRFVDVNIHPTKREVRFRDERVVRDAIRDIVRHRLESVDLPREMRRPAMDPGEGNEIPVAPDSDPTMRKTEAPSSSRETTEPRFSGNAVARGEMHTGSDTPSGIPPITQPPRPVQSQLSEMFGEADTEDATPEAFYEPVGMLAEAPLQIFDTYLIVPEEDRLLIIDQHALHERLTYDMLCADLEDREYASQQLAVPLLVDVPPSHVKLLESNTALFAKLGIELEPFGGNTFQVTAVCTLYDESRVPDIIYRVLDELSQGDLFDKDTLVPDLLRLAVEACRGSVKAGDRLTPEERRGLLEGFRRLRPPYTCPHGRPIITELTQIQMEKSFRRRQ
ncbi:MAG TPA: DNA mismatch repair endonuclease MutL [Candidatus Hydrogenedentes bacterium]|nr:DNA mismatch repair endonuclease MutL [Candidatus Hydrogenedentota bacterium]HPC18276.1 DNA mismatch repair endonuclease MutL [Candidatus Hydrogenedentota bacterium]HRT22008.1 DNA mismatch repair endonuclease MutL [Candidatus Hydrogenedentota bacterium]HRT66703.1 DNA mismatch repair endonuclease MutL [Candidatus Hydrogenedentota bacterium]